MDASAGRGDPPVKDERSTSAFVGALPTASRCRDFGSLQLHGSAGSTVLQRQYREVPALVSGLCSRIDDLTNGTHGVDDLRAGGVGHELRDRVDLSCPVWVGRKYEQVGLGRFEAADGRLQHLREPLIEQ